MSSKRFSSWSVTRRKPIQDWNSRRCSAFEHLEDRRLLSATPTLTTLAWFSSTNGAGPQGTVVEDSSGNLFGTTFGGGTSGGGTVFEVEVEEPATLAAISGMPRRANRLTMNSTARRSLALDSSESLQQLRRLPLPDGRRRKPTTDDRLLRNPNGDRPTVPRG